MNNWEIERIHLIKRSFTKGSELKSHDWSHPSYYGEEFGDNKNTRLSSLGNKIISTFIKENEQQANTRKQHEEELDKLRHSKPPLNINPWKNALHTKGEFLGSEIDKVHSFRQYRPKRFLITDPFKRPKNDGDYFEKFVYQPGYEDERTKKRKLELKKEDENKKSQDI